MLSLLRGFLLSSSFPLSMNFSRRSPEEFRWKIFAGEDFQQLFVLVVRCHLHKVARDSPIVNFHGNTKCSMKSLAKKPSDIFKERKKERKMGHQNLQLPKTTRGSRAEIINSLRSRPSAGRSIRDN